ncbi:MAG: hypothetical protein JSU63_02100 [Phycisphaerales bacterium]|nr:MAG: hypothetical protein JSU63_02100 [Phycisphaerales bacterium]
MRKLVLAWWLPLDTRRTHAVAAFPQTHLVPRKGTLACVTVGDGDQLRELRTELELLRRIGRHAASQAAGRVQPANVKKYSDADRGELRQILGDASHPAVDETIGWIDRDFAGVREEIMMSVVNDEAERILQEAAEAGVLAAAMVASAANAAEAVEIAPDEAVPASEERTANAGEEVSDPDSSDQTSVDDTGGTTDIQVDETNTAAQPTASAEAVEEPAQGDSDDSVEPEAVSLDEALGAAEAELSAAVDAAQAPNGAPDEPVTSDSTGDTTEAEDADSTTSNADDSSAEIHAEDIPSDEDATASEAVCAEATSHADQTPQLEQDQPAAVVEPGGFDARVTPERAAQEVEAIESGIRRLSDLLTEAVHGQWASVTNAFAEMRAKRVEIEEAGQAARSMLEEINRIKEEAGIARSEADIARREARLLREEAKRAKERADASATAAELAANQASQEAEAMRSCAAGTG